jgi:hypothetical protein
LPGATVRVAGAGSTSTAVDGTYTIFGIRAGQAQVTVSHLGFFTENTLVQFKDHQIVEMDFPMDRHIIGPHSHEGSTRKPPGVPWPDTTMLASTKAGKRGAQRPMGRRRARL